MHIWMYVIREMEDALDDCKEGCIIDNCNDDPVHGTYEYHNSNTSSSNNN